MKTFYGRGLNIDHSVFGSFVFLILIMAFALYMFGLGFPDYKGIEKVKIPFSTRMYSSDYKMFSELRGDEYRIYVPYHKIPLHTVYSFVAAEDKTFFSNNGIDMIGIVRSVIDNTIRKRHFISGGSTITQQVVKNYLLSPEKSITRKIKEAFLALRLTKFLSKERIMELYLNKIYFGHGAYGIEAASLTYFGKSTPSLSLPESALLASIPPAPTKLDPFHNANIKGRRNIVLRQMLESKFISQQEFEEAVNTPIILHNGQNTNKILNADFFADEARKQTSRELNIDDIENKGYSIKTTLSSNYQKIADEALVAGLRKYENNYSSYSKIISHLEINNDNWLTVLNNEKEPQGIKELELAVVLDAQGNNYTVGRKSGLKSKMTGIRNYSLQKGDLITASCNEKTCVLQPIPSLNGAVVVMEANTGNILALSGGYDYKKSQFNVATQALRQPGSTFKPFVYLAALENHMTPRTIVDDSELEIPQGDNLMPWKPRNYNNAFFGTLTLRRALEVSQNTASVQIAKYIGIKKVSETARRFGLYESRRLKYSAVLGSKELNLLTLVSSYAALANGGQKVSPNFILSIRDKDNNIIINKTNYSCDQCEITNSINIYPKYNPDLPFLSSQHEKIANSEEIFQISDFMRGAVLRGTSKRLSNAKEGISGKTGTSNQGVDFWFVGFRDNVVIGVFIGSDIPKVTDKNISGAGVALPVFKNFIEKLENERQFYIKMPKSLDYTYIDLESGQHVEKNTPENEIILESFKNLNTTYTSNESKVRKFALNLENIHNKQYNRKMQTSENDFIMRDLLPLPESSQENKSVQNGEELYEEDLKDFDQDEYDSIPEPIPDIVPAVQMQMVKRPSNLRHTQRARNKQIKPIIKTNAKSSFATKESRKIINQKIFNKTKIANQIEKIIQ